MVDTSLHMGEMAWDEAVRFMTAHTALTEPTAKAEVILHEKTRNNKVPPHPADLERRKQQLVTKLLRGSRRRLWK